MTPVRVGREGYRFRPSSNLSDRGRRSEVHIGYRSCCWERSSLCEIGSVAGRQSSNQGGWYSMDFSQVGISTHMIDWWSMQTQILQRFGNEIAKLSIFTNEGWSRCNGMENVPGCYIENSLSACHCPLLFPWLSTQYFGRVAITKLSVLAREETAKIQTKQDAKKYGQ
jgi:hypothetical protein